MYECGKRNLSDGLDAFLAHKPQAIFDRLLEEIQEIFFGLFFQQVSADVVHPRLDVRQPLEILRITEDHPASETYVTIMITDHHFLA